MLQLITNIMVKIVCKKTKKPHTYLYIPIYKQIPFTCAS